MKFNLFKKSDNTKLIQTLDNLYSKVEVIEKKLVEMKEVISSLYKQNAVLVSRLRKKNEPKNKS